MPTFINPAQWAGRVTSVLGDPRPYGKHEGIDFAPTGPGPHPVTAAASGKVIAAGYDADGYGNYVKIDHGDGFQTIYGHFKDTPTVQTGQQVAAGALLGEAGSTGYSTGTHLHFSIVQNGKYLDPALYVDFAQRVAGDAVDAVSRAVQDALSGTPLAQIEGECEKYRLMGDQHGWRECMKDKLADNPDALDQFKQENPEQAQGTIDSIIDSLWPDNLKDSLWPDDTPDWAKNISKDIKSSIIDPLQKQAVTALTYPARLTANTFKLADPPLTSGEDTWAWLSQPENQGIMLATSAALLIVLVLTIGLVLSFAWQSEPVQTVVKVAA